MNGTEKLDRLGQEWCALPAGGCDAVRCKLKQDIFLEISRLYPPDGGGAPGNAIGEFFLRDWPRFDASAGSLSDFVRLRLRYRLEDMDRQDFDGRRTPMPSNRSGEEIRVKVPHESLEAILEQPCRENTLTDHTDPAPAALLLDDLLLEQLTLMLHLQDHLKGRARNPARIGYFRIFYTDTSVEILHTGGSGRFYLRHERDLFRAVKTEFLDYILRRVCRTAAEIATCALKPYGELVEGRDMETEPEQPLPLDVIQSYLQRQENTSVGLSAISMQRSAYYSFMKEHLEC